MGTGVLILGDSGSGKSASLRNLNLSEVSVINIAKKPLPFRGSKSVEVINVSSADAVMKSLTTIKNNIIVIDDFQYIMSFFMMAKVKEAGYAKFTDIAKNICGIFETIRNLPEDKRVYILSHSEIDENGREKMKTVGKMLDSQIKLEGLLTIVMKAVNEEGIYSFITKSMGNDTVKTPFDMFPSSKIDNDLRIVDDIICEYYEIKVMNRDEAKETDLVKSFVSRINEAKTIIDLQKIATVLQKTPKLQSQKDILTEEYNNRKLELSKD